MRKHYLDNIRFITVIMVVVFHVFYFYNNIGISAMFEGAKPYNGDMTAEGIYQYFVYPWFMLLLFVVSGISAAHALQKRTVKQFLKERRDKILVPSTLGIAAFGWIGGYVNYYQIALANMPEGVPVFVKCIIILLSGIGALWFCHALLVAILVLLAVRTILSGFKLTDNDVREFFVKLSDTKIGLLSLLLTLYFLLWGTSKIFNAPVITAYRFGIYTAAFLIGYYILLNDEIISKLKKNLIPLEIMTLMSFICYINTAYGIYYADISLLSKWYTNLYAYLMILVILAFGAKYLDKENNFTKYMSRRSFGIYVFHIPVMLVLNYFISRTGAELYIIYVCELVVGFVFSVLLYEVISRIPILRYFILGIRKSS